MQRHRVLPHDQIILEGSELLGRAGSSSSGWLCGLLYRHGSLDAFEGLQDLIVTSVLRMTGHTECYAFA